MAGSQPHRTHADSSLKYLMLLALVAALVYTINRWIVIPRYGESSFFHNYLGDILALPVYLPLSLYTAVRFGLVKKTFKITILHILGATIVFSLIFEGLIPSIGLSSIRDPWDVLAYLAGGALVYMFDTSIHYRHRSIERPNS